MASQHQMQQALAYGCSTVAGRTRGTLARLHLQAGTSSSRLPGNRLRSSRNKALVKPVPLDHKPHCAHCDKPRLKDARMFTFQRTEAQWCNNIKAMMAHAFVARDHVGYEKKGEKKTPIEQKASDFFEERCVCFA